MGGARRPGRLRARAAVVTREIVFGRNAVREALRGRREVLDLWVSERAAAALAGAADGAGRTKAPVRRQSQTLTILESRRTPDRRPQTYGIFAVKRRSSNQVTLSALVQTPTFPAVLIALSSTANNRLPSRNTSK